MKKVFITGANGFIGQRLSQLLQTKGVATCGIDLKGSPEQQIIQADLFDVEKWRGLLAECDGVIHTAAVVSNGATEEHTWRVNVLGTQALLDASAALNKKQRFMHFSSVAALGFRNTGEMDERCALRASGQKYADSKLASEHLVLNYHNAGEVDGVIIRPADVYGPGSIPWIVKPLTMMKQNQFAVPRGGMFGPVYIDDLIEGCYLALTSPKAAGQIFILSGMGEVSNETYFTYIATMLGKNGIHRLPGSVLYPLAYLAERFAHFVGKETELNPSSVAMLSRPSAQYSHAKATALLGYQPRVSLEEGMRRSEAWLKQTGML